MANDNTLFYQYIAASNPMFVKSICERYGFTVPVVRNYRELGDLLRQLVERTNGNAFLEIVDNHPDKELILDTYKDTPAADQVGCDGMHSDGGCKKCKEKYSNVTGSTETAVVSQDKAAIAALQAQNTAIQHHGILNNNNNGVLILSCAIIVALAIMSKKQ